MVTLEDAKAVASQLAKTIHPISVIVFGSVARTGQGADLDLLIITEDVMTSPDKAEALKTVDARTHAVLTPFYKKIAIDPFVLPRSLVLKHFMEGSPFLRHIQKEGRCLFMKESVLQWIKQAKEEQLQAKYLMEGGYYPGACFHGQQSIEKTIKGALTQKGWDLEKIHSIERLIALSEQYGLSPQISEEDAVFIDSVYRGRYPAEEGLLPTGEPTKEDAERIVTVAANLLTRLFPNE